MGIACAELNPVTTTLAKKATAIKFFMRFLPILANLDGYHFAPAGSFDHAAVKNRNAQALRSVIGDQRRPQGIAAQIRSCR